jgi:outer membrane protein assembly factor BamB
MNLAAAQAAPSQAMDQNWSQWRGPVQTGVAPEANPPTEWSEKKNVKWKVEIPGEGSSSPIVWENKIFIVTAVPTGKKANPPGSGTAGRNLRLNLSPAPALQAQPSDPPRGGQGERGRGRGRGGPGGGRGGFGRGEKPTEVHQFAILCIDRQTGETLWKQIAREEVPHEGHHPADGSYAAPSAVTDGKHVIASFGSRGLYCYDMEGNLQWTQDLGDMQTLLTFGEGTSPALYKDTLIVKWDHEGDSFIVALDKNTGKTIWKEPREEVTSWSTPVVVEHDGKAQVITTATGKIRSYDLATGKVIWGCGGLTRNVIPSPVVGNGIVYCMSGFRGTALLAIRLGRTGDLTGTDAIVWQHGKATPYVPSPLLYGDKLYFFSHNNGILSCFDAISGNPHFSEERIGALKGGVYASPVGAAGRVYLLSREGSAVVLKLSDKLEVLATNELDDRFDASPAVVGNEIILRGKKHLYCLAGK